MQPPPRLQDAPSGAEYDRLHPNCRPVRRANTVIVGSHRKCAVICDGASAGGEAAQSQKGLDSEDKCGRAASWSWSRGGHSPHPLSVTSGRSPALSGPPFPCLKHGEKNSIYFRRLLRGFTETPRAQHSAPRRTPTESNSSPDDDQRDRLDRIPSQPDVSALAVPSSHKASGTEPAGWEQKIGRAHV